VLSRPAGVTDDALRQSLAEHWQLAVTELEYRPVGFGSHHWDGREGDGTRWFVTVDEVGRDPSRLRAALATAVALRTAGCDFVVAPIPTGAAEPCAPMGDSAVALYPHIDGTSFAGGEYASEEHRRGVLDLVVALHRQLRASVPDVREEDFVIPCREDLEAGLARRPAPGTGPYTDAIVALLDQHGSVITAALARYDLLATRVAASGRPFVVTHGEPHAANTIATARGLVLIDWDTALFAPPERDLFTLDHRGGGILRAYAAATGTDASLDALRLYRLQWDLHDIAVYTRRLRAPHDGNEDDEKSWRGLQATVEDLATEASGWVG